MKTIFISIAAYQDPLLEDTIKSAIDNAVYPDRLRFGVALQYYDDPDLSDFSNVKTISYHPDSRPGIVRVRYNISAQLFEGEDFYLQIDSHYLFSEGWDIELENYYKLISDAEGTERVMIFPLEKYDDEIMTSRFELVMEESEHFGKFVHPHPVNSRSCMPSDYHEIFFSRVGQIFFPGRYIYEVGLDQYSQTSLEIAYFSYRTVMSGYRVFQINKKILWQNDKEYFKQVWNTDAPEKALRMENRFSSGVVGEGRNTWHELSLALIYNDFSKYAVRGAEMSPEYFWELQGSLGQYLEAKNYFDQVLYNNL